MSDENLGLIFVDGKMLSATEAAAYIKELRGENEKLKIDNSLLRVSLNNERKKKTGCLLEGTDSCPYQGIPHTPYKPL